MKTLVFLLLVLPPSWSTPRLGQKDSDLDAKLELEDGGVHSHEDPYTIAARVADDDDKEKKENDRGCDCVPWGDGDDCCFNEVCATLFENGDYTGKSLDLYKNTPIYNLVESGWNDKISSIRTIGASIVEAFEHSNFEGGKQEIFSDINLLSPNDWISSLRCYDDYDSVCAILFEQGDYTGKSMHLYKNKPISNLVESGWNDQISSIRTILGSVVQAFEHSNFEGGKQDISSDINLLSPNDWISSLRCYDDSESGRIVYKWTSNYDLIWKDSGSGGDHDVSIWRPILESGYCLLGDVAVGSYGKPSTRALLVKINEAVTTPTGFTQNWKDTRSGSDWDGSLWAMDAPSGFTCLGGAAKRDYNPPDRNQFCCVKNKYVVAGNLQWTWNDAGSWSSSDASVWTVVKGSDTSGLEGGNFLPGNGHDKPSGGSLLKVDSITVIEE